MRTSLTLVSLLLLAACEKPIETDNAASNDGETAQPAASYSTPELAKIEAEMARLAKLRTNPDQTVKSFIMLANLKGIADCHFETAVNDRRNAVDSSRAEMTKRYYLKMLSGQMYENLADDLNGRDLSQCLKYRGHVAVQIKSVDMPSPTQALVVANLKNVAAIPSGADMSMMDRRNAGETVRYVLQRQDSGWVISNYEQNEDDGWRAYFRPKEPDKPYLPWIVTPF